MLCAAAASSSFCRRSFWHRAFSLSSFHACSLTLLLSMPFLLYVCAHTYKHTYICWCSLCVCIGICLAQFDYLFKQFAIYCNYCSFYCIHSDTWHTPNSPFIYVLHPHTQNTYMHTYVRRCGCDVGGSLCEDLMLAVCLCACDRTCVCWCICWRMCVCACVCARKSINVPLSFWLAPFYSHRTHFVTICLIWH